jgi:hypothetical protein
VSALAACDSLRAALMAANDPPVATTRIKRIGLSQGLATNAFGLLSWDASCVTLLGFR